MYVPRDCIHNTLFSLYIMDGTSKLEGFELNELGLKDQVQTPNLGFAKNHKWPESE